MSRAGESENAIKDLKRACFADRLSDHRFWANQFRLLLHAAAYWLLDTLRRWLVAMHVAPHATGHPAAAVCSRSAAASTSGTTGSGCASPRSHPGQPLWDALGRLLPPP